MTEEMPRRFAPDLMAGQVALVTGSGSGMGRATALEMASCGAKLALFARREEPLQETAEMIRAKGGEALVVPGDTRDEASIETAMRRIKDHYGKLDVLVNNAGGQFISAARDLTNKGFEAVIRNNLIGSWQMTRAAADHFMFENGGSIVFVTAISTRTALTGFAHTVAARAGVTGMMKTLAAEWGEYGIRLNCVAPGTIKTEALGRYPIPMERWRELNRSVLNRMGAAEDISGAIIFLASKIGGFITGEDLYVDGGETLHLGHDARDMIHPEMFQKRQRADGKHV
ncbi:SDR family NAD(P)-dependent oxidoreductase [Acidocella sp.]|uniref:SDR family NAD(P)-dependent oxidoreductase n=1 Tax=Acidocella sp. TaxID=50710 RepID=UPI002603F5E0|nr:SDR family oxidoreductase [Acidocella sp.]